MDEITRFLLLVCVGVTVSTVVDLQKRIYGGKECGQHERSYHVRLISNNGTRRFLCGGSLINKMWILTAAHCWKDGRNMTAFLGVHPRGPGRNITRIPITEAPVKYTDDTGYIHDIMLLKLPQETDIEPVKLPDCKERKKPKRDDEVQIAGYGANITGPNLERGNSTLTALQCAKTKVVNCYRLRVLMRSKNWSRLTQHWFCGQAPGVDACKGDSGGGVVFNDMIYGVISFTGNNTHACVQPVAFMDVCEYKKWIEDYVGRPRTLFDKFKTCVSCG